MAKAAYKAEQVWLRAFLEYQDEVFFEIQAQRSMARLGIDIADVMRVLRNGRIVRSERDECGAKIIVAGMTCDDEDLLVEGHIVSELMTVSVINVIRNLRLEK